MDISSLLEGSILENLGKTVVFLGRYGRIEEIPQGGKGPLLALILLTTIIPLVFFMH